MTISQMYLQTWAEARTRFSNLLIDLDDAALEKMLPNTLNSAGFLIEHIAEVELLFAKNVFGAEDIRIQAKTVIQKRDTGEWTNAEEVLAQVQYAFDSLSAIILKQTDEDWVQTIVTKEFGTKTKAEALGRIISHTAYHAEQLALALKYGE